MKINIESNSFGYCELKTRWVGGTVSDSIWRIYQNGNLGAIVYDTQGKAHPILPNEIMIIPAWTIWKGVLEKPVHHSHISFVTPQWSTVYSRRNFPDILKINSENEHYQMINHCYEYLRNNLKLEDNSKKNNERFASMREAAIHLSLAYVFKEYSLTGDARPILILKVLEYIDDNLAENLSVERLAKIQLCTTAHFSRIFRKCMSQSPSSYVRERRITNASQLLINTNRSIEQVAESCGFYDRFHFSKIFKDLMKRSPAEYKKINAIGR